MLCVLQASLKEGGPCSFPGSEREGESRQDTLQGEAQGRESSQEGAGQAHAAGTAAGRPWQWRWWWRQQDHRGCLRLPFQAKEGGEEEGGGRDIRHS